ncbi:MAG: cyclophilin-like fold protein [Candidatus Methylophosphatis roskildensis]
MRIRTGYVALTLWLALSHAAVGAGDRAADTGSAARTSAGSSQGAGTMKIRLTINGRTVTASLNDNATARDFLSLLPLTLTLEDYAATEKIAYLPRKLSTAGAPAGFDPSMGEITYYAPWGNVAIFYRDFRYSEGLISLGRIDSGIEALKVPGALKATIEPDGK